MTAAEHGNEYELAAVAAAVLRGDRQSAEPGDFSEQSSSSWVVTRCGR